MRPINNISVSNKKKTGKNFNVKYFHVTFIKKNNNNFISIFIKLIFHENFSKYQPLWKIYKGKTTQFQAYFKFTLRNRNFILNHAKPIVYCCNYLTIS